MFRKFLIISALTLLAGTGCVDVATENAPPDLPEFITATLPPTSIPQATHTPHPPTSIPTTPPVAGTTNTQINVRAETNTASESYGVIPAFTQVQITGKDTTGTWVQILYPESMTGSGWVRAEYVQTESMEEIQVRDVATVAGTSGLVVSGINVRSGPGTNFDSLGVLVPKDVVWVTGRDEGSAWVQFLFSPASDGIGWAAVEFLQIEDVESLPVIAQTAAATEETPSVETEAPTVAQIAQPDGDSAESPLTQVDLASSGSRAFQVQGDVSTPAGDLDDWVAFSSASARIAIDVSCASEGLLVELWQAGSVVESSVVACGGGSQLTVTPNVLYVLRLSIPSTNAAAFTEYVLKVEARP